MCFETFAHFEDIKNRFNGSSKNSKVEKHISHKLRLLDLLVIIKKGALLSQQK
jgi:hypothetical protein